MLRDKIMDSMKQAQKDQNRKRVSTLRLVHAAIVDRDIALRGKGKDKADDDEVLDILAKMIKQREESSKLYDEGDRAELAEEERLEIEIIREFMPKQLSEQELREAVSEAIEETGAESLRDMGKVMSLLKERFRGQIDMGQAGGLLKKQLSN